METASLANKFNVQDTSQPGHIAFDVTYWRTHNSPPLTFRIRGTDVLPSQENWESQLNEQEKLEVFNRILAEYRTYSNRNDGVRSAALAISDILDEEGKPQSTHLHIHANTDEAIAYHKDCAEANTVRAMLPPTQHQGKIRTLYLMASVDSSQDESPKRFEPPIPPCGKCCDILEKYTQPDAVVYNLPGNDGLQELSLNTTARTPAGLAEGEVWKLPMHPQRELPTSLMAYRTLNLERDLPAATQAQTKGWAALVEGRHLKKPDIRDLQVRAMAGQELNETEREILRIEKAIHEIKHSDKDTIAKLEASPTTEHINEYMVRQIQETYQKRKDSFARKDNGYEEPQKIRCVIVRLSDGSFHKGMEVVGKGSNASPPAEMASIDRANSTFEEVTDVWVMEADAQDIAQGRMQTSTKEGLERLFKRRPKHDGITDLQGKPIKDNINIHFIAFNDGTLNGKDLKDIIFTKPFEEFFPSAFIGAAQMKENGCNSAGHCR